MRDLIPIPCDQTALSAGRRRRLSSIQAQPARGGRGRDARRVPTAGRPRRTTGRPRASSRPRSTRAGRRASPPPAPNTTARTRSGDAAHFDAPAAPHPARRAVEPDPHLVREAHTVLLHHARRRQLACEHPFFQASCASRSACSCTGRGALGAKCSRARKLQAPPSV